MELVNIANSGLKGFPETTMTPLPFNFDIQDVNAFVSVAMLPSMPIGFKFQSMLDASVSVDMELPRLDAQISMVTDVDMNCNPVSVPEEDADAPVVEARHFEVRQDAPFPNETESTAPKTNLIAGPLVHIESNASMLVELGFNLAFPLVPLPPMAASAQIFTTATPLPTLCLVPTAGFKPATDVFKAGVTSTPVAGTEPITLGTPGATASGSSMPVVPTDASGNSSLRRRVTDAERAMFLGAANGRRGEGWMGWQFGVMGVSFAVGWLMVGL
jgi:hypothetical protein